MQVTENVINHQTNRFARENGKDPETLTKTQRKEMKAAMLKEYYPGKVKFHKYKRKCPIILFPYFNQLGKN